MATLPELTASVPIFENFRQTGKTIKFGVMIRPIEAREALGEAMGNRIGPQPARLKPATAAPR